MRAGKFVLHHSKQRKGNAIYVYYMIAWYFRKDGKPLRHVIKHLGRLNEYEVEYYKNTIACMNNEPHVVPCNINKVFVRNSKEYLSCAIGIHFWDLWELSSVFGNSTCQKKVSTTDIAKILTILRLAEPVNNFWTLIEKNY